MLSRDHQMYHSGCSCFVFLNRTKSSYDEIGCRDFAPVLQLDRYAPVLRTCIKFPLPLHTGKIFATICRNVSPCTYQLFILPLLAIKISNFRFEMRMFILITTRHYMRQSVQYLILASLTQLAIMRSLCVLNLLVFMSLITSVGVSWSVHIPV